MKEFYVKAKTNFSAKAIYPNFDFLDKFEYYSEESNGKDFLLYIEILFRDGFILKKEFKTIYPDGCIDLVSYRKSIEEKLLGYSFEFIDNNEYLAIKFSNVINSKMKIYSEIKNTYLDFYNRNKFLVSQIIEKIGMKSGGIIDANLFYRSNTPSFKIEVYEEGFKVFYDDYYEDKYLSFKKTPCISSETILYSSMGICNLSNSFDVYKLGYSIYKYFANRKALYIEKSLVMFQEDKRINLEFKCEYECQPGKFYLFLKPIIEEKEKKLNTWN